MIELQCPIREAQHFGWQHKLKDLNDFKKCMTQKFGENPDYYAHLGIIGHSGIDIPYQRFTECYASHDGVVDFSGVDVGGGLGVILKTDGFKTYYWHFQELKVAVGDVVKKGQLLGLGDSTGFSTGSHLHFELKLLDNNGNVLNPANGYHGAVDPLPYIVWFKDVRFVKLGVDGVCLVSE